ncbi:hypothetical protein [Streptomyces sp. NPDC019224]|uniref:SCO4225 family membrane protein n=1 Tax=Streptomyces sp. NPDC019224 TaxID=3154484 RepID=UPI0033CDD971
MNQRTVRTLVRLTVGNAASPLYPGAVVAAAVFVTVDTLPAAHEDASFAGVRLFLPAAPTVFVFLFAASLTGAKSFGPARFTYPALTVSVPAQSRAHGRFVRGGGRRTRATRPQGA